MTKYFDIARHNRWRPSHLIMSIGVAASLMSASLAVNAAQQVLWYPFDDLPDSSVITDMSGHGYNASVKGGVTLTGDAAYLDGSDGYIDLPDNLMAGLNSISVTAEIFIDSKQASPYFIYGLGSISSNEVDGYLFTTGNHYRTALSNCNAWSCEQSTETPNADIPRGSWQHIAYTLENNTGILYLNGKEVSRNDNITLSPADIGSGSTATNFLGRSLYSGDHYFYGAFADFQIWDGALTPEEIAAMVPKQVLWYPFNDDPGSTAIADASGNNNNAVAKGGVALNGTIAQLDGDDDYIDLPDNVLANLDEITVMTKVLIETDQVSPYFIYGLGNTSGANGNGYLFTTGNYYRTTLSSCNWSCEQTAGTLNKSIPRGDWQHLAYTLKGDTGILYLDGVALARNENTTLTPASIGNGATLANYLGRSLYSSDNYLHGSFDDFQIWDGALSASAIATIAKEALVDIQLDDAESVSVDTGALQVVNADDIRGHIFLASEGEHKTTISWTSDNTDVITTDGIVTRAPACGADTNNRQCGITQYVTLTATITKGKEAARKTFQTTVHH